MNIRRTLPVLIALAVFGGLAVVVGVLISESKDDEYYIVKDASRIASGLYEAQKLKLDVDYRIESIAVFSRDDKRAVVRVVVPRYHQATDTYYWEMEKGDGGWSIGRNLQEHFALMMKSDTLMDDMRGRFRQAIEGRYKPPVEVDGSTFGFVVADQKLDTTFDVIATTDFMFKAGPSNCRYVETWRYKDRTWKIDGIGRIFEGDAVKPEHKTPTETPMSRLIAGYRRHYGGIPQKIVSDGVRTLSEMFNGQRPMRPGYLAKHNLRQAYVCYYLPTNHAKVKRVLKELTAFAEFPKTPRILDFGSGPGTASLAALETFDNPDLTLVDIVGEALTDAEVLIKLTEKKVGKLRSGPEVPRDRKYDLILAANVLAELRDPVPLRRLLEESLVPSGYLVLIEPALRETTRRVMEWRDDLHAAGWKIAAPCLGIASCPMRAQSDLWCHQEAPWDRPPGLELIDRKLGFDKEHLKYSYLVVTKEGKTRGEAPGADWRVVSNLHRQHGKSWAWLCGKAGPLVAGELLKRHRNDSNRVFEQARRGDILAITPPPTGRFAPETTITAS